MAVLLKGDVIMDIRIQKAFDFASDTTKQFITLSTAIIALTITFTKDILGTVSEDTKLFLMAAWGFYIISIIFGVFTMMALTGTLEPKDKKFKKPSIWGSNITMFSGLQIITFLVATILIVIYGINSI
jgi:hypothetical protein